jgi:hypothetical protein
MKCYLIKLAIEFEFVSHHIPTLFSPSLSEKSGNNSKLNMIPVFFTVLGKQAKRVIG